MSKTCLYRQGSEPNPDVYNRLIESRVFDDEDVAEALNSGWYGHPGDVPEGSADLLDQPAREIIAALPGLSDDDLLSLLDKETGGKTRKGVIAAIEAEVKNRESNAS